MQASMVAPTAAGSEKTHQYAIRVSDNACVYAGTEDKSRKENYLCFCPDGPHPLILRQSSGRDDVGDYTTNCAHYPVTKCRGNCGESEEHSGAKRAISDWFMNPACGGVAPSRPSKKCATAAKSASSLPRMPATCTKSRLRWSATTKSGGLRHCFGAVR